MYVHYNPCETPNNIFADMPNFGDLANFTGCKWGDAPSTSFWIIPTRENFENAC